MRLLIAMLIGAAVAVGPAGAQEKRTKGSCGAPCEDVEKGNFSCGKRERPTWDEAKHCTCEPASECAE